MDEAEDAGVEVAAAAAAAMMLGSTCWRRERTTWLGYVIVDATTWKCATNTTQDKALSASGGALG